MTPSHPGAPAAVEAMNRHFDNTDRYVAEVIELTVDRAGRGGASRVGLPVGGAPVPLPTGRIRPP
ncbi:hypothetical protein [Streptomyces sp. NPDC051684]|uniref:hypothetical protein n=1 Tax=Streptomyces sp. NPDC051684 TaxID=3365670 RepID=UPI003796CD92